MRHGLRATILKSKLNCVRRSIYHPPTQNKTRQEVQSIVKIMPTIYLVHEGIVLREDAPVNQITNKYYVGAVDQQLLERKHNIQVQ